MLAALGSAGVLVAFGASITLAVQGYRQLRRPAPDLVQRLRMPILTLLGGAVLAMLALELALLTDDFSLAYVADHHTSSTPFVFTVATAWAALEGSIVLWGLVLAGFVYGVGRRLRRDDNQPDRLGAGALATMAVVAAFFFGLMLTVANPFEVCVEAATRSCLASSPLPWAAVSAPADGLGPNPLLQNHILMAIHPPILYVGYVGMTVPFGFGIAALLLGAGGIDWLARTRRWTLLAWSFLTAGILLGGWWSYEVLGWGGYWAWDPVENASFMPWLLGTAFLHSAVVQQRRGVLRSWNVILAIGTFALTILGTFLTRSGTINSVHSFTQSAIGPALLGFLVLVLIGSLGLFAWRGHLVASTPKLESLASREGAFLANNLILSVFTLVVLAGTLFPLFVEAFTGDQVGVGRPYFDRLAIPLSLLLLLVMGIGVITPYGKASGRVVWERIRTPLRVALGVAALTVLLGERSGWLLLTIVAGTFVLGVIARALIVTAKKRPGKPLERLRAVIGGDRHYWGGQLSHVGIVVVALGIAFSANLSESGTVELAPGETGSVAGFELTYLGGFSRQAPNREEIGGRVEVARSGTVRAVLEPRLNLYEQQVQPVPSPGVMTRPSGDLYLSLRRIDGSGIFMEVTWFPVIWMVWAGGLLAAAGGLYAWTGTRARRRTPIAR